jgi:hypothetical protein
MLKTTLSVIALGAAAVITTGCGLSYDYQRNSLLGAGPSTLCYAATDPRIGGFAVRRQAAQDLVDQRGIQCNYGAEAGLHAGQAEAQQLGIGTSLNAISTGLRMTQPTPVSTCTGDAYHYTCTIPTP